MKKETKCARCADSTCCSYLTQQIDTPRSIYDFETLLWQIAHKNIQIFQDEQGWFLLINNPCSFLLPGGGCGIYAKRPAICRDHTNDYCEYDAPAKGGYKRFFPTYASLERYCRRRFKNWSRRHARG